MSSPLYARLAASALLANRFTPGHPLHPWPFRAPPPPHLAGCRIPDSSVMPGCSAPFWLLDAILHMPLRAIKAACNLLATWRSPDRYVLSRPHGSAWLIVPVLAGQDQFSQLRVFVTARPLPGHYASSRLLGALLFNNKHLSTRRKSLGQIGSGYPAGRGAAGRARRGQEAPGNTEGAGLR